ncbi:hypothetical protein [Mucilaginibacter psychrotolerans]|uniref:Uncharacterized protein n=1 Tax=Mucilaginibacter psychrotolerans TaxID=1524096 RepID=A0A4Y8SMG9_9SPHI|nr:hypothetical protein [Mucilaginibacter psychrotolerans]TFF39821.1 hypothetical protein E2R66_05515 [Mucilaginibacter psychrotolerans]
MKNFTIICTIKNELQKLNVIFKQSSFACFYIYKNNKWIGTIHKKGDEQYVLISYSKFVFSQTDVISIAKELTHYEKSHRYTTAFCSTLKAA